MPDLNVDLDYFDHPKTLRLAALLGRGGAEIPLRLWAKAGKFSPKIGAFDGYTASELEGLIGWWGEVGKAVEALIRVGFLDQTETGFAVHDWKQHQGHIWSLKIRNKKVSVNRWKNLRSPSKKSESSDDTTGKPLVSQNNTSGIPQPTNQQTSNEQIVALFNLWNSEAHADLSRAMALSSGRKRSARARLSERPLEDWRGIIARINASPFCRGINNTGWRADFDWLLRPDTAVKVLEGKYDSKEVLNGSGQRINPNLVAHD